MTNTFCPLPWTSVATKNDGCFRVCCHANVSDRRGLLTDSEEKVLNAKNHNISAVRNSRVLKEVRSKMMRGEWPEACSRCQREESVGLRSKRQYAHERIKLNVNSTQSGTTVDGEISIEEFPLRDLDLRFGNKCNLKCRMCGPSDSSSWYTDYEKLHGRFYQPPSSLNWYENEDFWDDLQRNSSSLEHIYIVGGEPLLIEKHYEFLEYLISENRSLSIVLEYNTNLTLLPEKVLNLWTRFKEVRIGVSVDAWGPLNNYIRHPSQFSIVERNLERLDQSPGNIVVWLASTVSIINLYDLSELMLWKIRKRFQKINGSARKPLLTHHVLHKPEYLNIQCLPQEAKGKILRLLPGMRERFLTEVQSEGLGADAVEHLLAKWNEIYQSLLSHMLARDLSEQFPEFVSYTQNLDKIRDEKLKDVVASEYFQLLMGTEGEV